MEWQSYDPTWLVDLAMQQKPELTWLHEALKSCTRAQRDNPTGDEEILYFIDRMEGKFLTNVILVSPEHSQKIVLDILTDKRVGSLSFTRLMPGEGL